MAEKKRVCLNLDQEVYRQLQAEAKTREVSASWLLRQFLKQGLENGQ